MLPRSALIGEPGAADAAVEWLIDLAVTVQVAEMCGAMRWAFDTTLEWSLTRYSFGRPLASYQEIKHRFADMKLWLEASYAITAQAADAVDRDLAEPVGAGECGEVLRRAIRARAHAGLCADARRDRRHLRPPPPPVPAPRGNQHAPLSGARSSMRPA